MEISNQSPAYFNQQASVLKQQAAAQAQNAFPQTEPAHATPPRQASPDESKQKANVDSSLWQAAQHSSQSQGIAQDQGGVSNDSGIANQRSQQAIAAYEATQKPAEKVGLDALI